MTCYRLPDGTIACGMLPLVSHEYVRKGYIRNEFICADCAKKEGCTWPRNHLATFNSEIPCGYCGNTIAFDEGGVCETSDWEWPMEQIKSGDGFAREI